MKEEIPFEPPQNYSQISPEGELTPSRDSKSGFSRYMDEGGKYHFRISEFGLEDEEQPRKKQMVVQQLASLVVPVAPVYKTQVDGSKDYFSVDIQKHPEYNEGEKEINVVDNTFLQIMFDDVDHHGSHNHGGGVFYDFNTAQLSGIDRDEVKKWKGILKIVNKKPTDLLELTQRLKFFKQQIQGEGGLKFIQDICNHAGYTEFSPEEIQDNLIERSDIFMKQIGDIEG